MRNTPMIRKTRLPAPDAPLNGRFGVCLTTLFFASFIIRYSLGTHIRGSPKKSSQAFGSIILKESLKSRWRTPALYEPYIIGVCNGNIKGV